MVTAQRMVYELSFGKRNYRQAAFAVEMKQLGFEEQFWG
jgi:hypothetical protein